MTPEAVEGYEVQCPIDFKTTPNLHALLFIALHAQTSFHNCFRDGFNTHHNFNQNHALKRYPAFRRSRNPTATPPAPIELDTGSLLTEPRVSIDLQSTSLLLDKWLPEFNLLLNIFRVAVRGGTPTRAHFKKSGGLVPGRFSSNDLKPEFVFRVLLCSRLGQDQADDRKRKWAYNFLLKLRVLAVSGRMLGLDLVLAGQISPKVRAFTLKSMAVVVCAGPSPNTFRDVVGTWLRQVGYRPKSGHALLSRRHLGRG